MIKRVEVKCNWYNTNCASSVAVVHILQCWCPF